MQEIEKKKREARQEMRRGCNRVKDMDNHQDKKQEVMSQYNRTMELLEYLLGLFIRCFSIEKSKIKNSKRGLEENVISKHSYFERYSEGCGFQPVQPIPQIDSQNPPTAEYSQPSNFEYLLSYCAIEENVEIVEENKDEIIDIEREKELNEKASEDFKADLKTIMDKNAKDEADGYVDNVKLGEPGWKTVYFIYYHSYSS